MAIFLSHKVDRTIPMLLLKVVQFLGLMMFVDSIPCNSKENEYSFIDSRFINRNTSLEDDFSASI